MTNMKKFLMLLTVAAIALMCFTGCSVNITSIGLPADMQLEKGETAQLEISYGADKENAKACLLYTSFAAHFCLPRASVYPNEIVSDRVHKALRRKICHARTQTPSPQPRS